MLKKPNKIQIDYSAPDIYQYYIDTYGNLHDLSQKQFTGITNEFYDKVIDLMIYHNIEFSFPKRLGNLRLIKYKTRFKLNKEGKLDKRKLRPNWQATKEMWKRIYPDVSLEEISLIKNKPLVFHENKHTEGYNLKWFWDKFSCNCPNKSAYSFDMARNNDRKLARALQQEELELNYYIQK